jgi:hypothetical protein
VGDCSATRERECSAQAQHQGTETVRRGAAGPEVGGGGGQREAGSALKNGDEPPPKKREQVRPRVVGRVRVHRGAWSGDRCWRGHKHTGKKPKREEATSAKCGNTDWCEVLNSRTLKKTHRHDATLEQAWTSVDRQHRGSAVTHQIVVIVVVGRVVSSHRAPVVVRSCRAVMQTHARKHKHTHKPSQTGYLSRGSSSCRTAGESKDHAHNTMKQRTLCVFPTIGVPDTSFRL